MATYDSPATVLKYYMAAQSLVGAIGADWPGYINHLPDGKDSAINAVCVYDTAGVQDGRMMRTGEVIEHPGVQICVRSSVYTTGWSKLETIARALDTVNHAAVIVSARAYTLMACRRATGIMPLSEPGNLERLRFVINYILTIRKD